MPDIRLLALDIDGTLLRSDRTISDRVSAAVRRASGRIPVILATARPPRSTRAIHVAMGLTTPQVNYNGALAWDRLAAEPRFHAPLTSDLVGSLIARGRSLVADVTVNFEHLDKWYTDRLDVRFVTETGRLFPPDVIGPIDAFVSLGATKLMFHADPADIRRLRAAMEVEYAGVVSFISTDADLLQMIDARASKWLTLVRVSETFGVGPQNIMAIGDNENDVEMIRAAAVGVAMGNGTTDAQAVADWIAPNNDDDGVAVAIERFLPRR